MSGFGATVYVQYPDGSVETASPSNGLFYQASISPRGDQLVFFGGVAGFPRLWSHRPGDDGDSPTPLTPEDSGARHPSFDWLGERIVFASDRSSPQPGETLDQISSTTRTVTAGIQMHIYTARPDGSEVRRITDGPFVDHRPTFSPDGDWIAFPSNRSGQTGIWSVPFDGSADPTPVFTDRWGYRPWYTHDEKWILCYGPDGRRHRIWKVNVGSGLTEPLVADDAGMTHGPFVGAERPDVVLAHSTRGGDWGIWEFPLNGRDQPSRCVTPGGFPMAAHATRSRNGILAFDVMTSDRVVDQESSTSKPSSA